MVISAADIYVAFYGLKKLSHIFWSHLICKAFDLYGILSYRELPVFEGEEGLSIIRIFLP